MKKYLLFAMCLLALVSCKDNGNTRQTADLNQRIDSLNRVNVQKDNEINDMLETLNTIEDGFRAINEAQGRVTIERRGEGADATQRIEFNGLDQPSPFVIVERPVNSIPWCDCLTQNRQPLVYFQV